MLRLLRRFSPALVFSALFAAVLASFRNRAALQVEVLALRHQLGILHRSVKRPKLTAADRLFWAWLSELSLVSTSKKFTDPKGRMDFSVGTVTAASRRSKPTTVYALVITDFKCPACA